ncbi:MAG TPA: histidine phosphatase family protein [Chloroflexia bacterium]|nr:histidine phosphatase family protein [Chloroflexia bacterium]
MVTNLYLIRHGEGSYQVEMIVPGMKGDTGLSPLGRQQAERLRERLKGTAEIKADVLIASNLARARQTAEIIAPALGLPVILDEEVQEMRPGEADGLTFQQAEQKYGKYPDYRQKPFATHAPGSENWPEFTLRAVSALERITREYAGKNIVVVCHGGVIDASMVYFFGLSGTVPPRVIFNTHNTSITHWRRGRIESMPDTWQMMSYNDTMHLRGLKRGQTINWTELSGTTDTGRDQMAQPIPTEEEEEAAENQ